DPDSPALILTAIDRSHNGSHQTVIAPGFDSIRIGSYRVAPSIGRDRLNVENEIIVPRHSDDHFDVRTTGQGQPAIVPAHVLIERARVDSIIVPFHIDAFVGP